jgi:hypothetical protein
MASSQSNLLARLPGRGIVARFSEDSRNQPEPEIGSAAAEGRRFWSEEVLCRRLAESVGFSWLLLVDDSFL